MATLVVARITRRGMEEGEVQAKRSRSPPTKPTKSRKPWWASMKVQRRPPQKSREGCQSPTTASLERGGARVRVGRETSTSSTSTQTAASSPRPVAKGSGSGCRSKMATRSTTSHRKGTDNKTNIKTTATKAKNSSGKQTKTRSGAVA